jgi:hypothetical protein
MPRPAKGPRLWRRAERHKGKRVIAKATWIIRDGRRHLATGCTTGKATDPPPLEAQKRLAAYIESKYAPYRKQRDNESIDCADVLAIFLDHKTPDPRPDDKSPEGIALNRLKSTVGRLTEYWGGTLLSVGGS